MATQGNPTTVASAEAGENMETTASATRPNHASDPQAMLTSTATNTPTPTLIMGEDGTVTKLELDASDSPLLFSKKVLEVRAGSNVELKIRNLSKTKGFAFNWMVLKSSAAIGGVEAAAKTAGPSRSFIPRLPEILQAVESPAPGQEITYSFRAPSPGEYPFVSTFPGQVESLKGILISVP